MTTEEYFGDWINVINKKELSKVVTIINKLYTTKKVLPDYKDIFKVFTLCNLNNVRCIILAQDPYPQKEMATGIAFANKCEISEDNISPSLKIIKEAVINFDIPHNSITFDNSLESWCKQGVFLLNSALTVELNKIGSHSNIWRPFVSSLLHNISNYQPGILYVLMGSQAQTFEPYINKCNTIIKCKHPAYYVRTNTRMPNIFRTISDYVNKYYAERIEWFKESEYGYKF